MSVDLTFPVLTIRVENDAEVGRSGIRLVKATGSITLDGKAYAIPKDTTIGIGLTDGGVMTATVTLMLGDLILERTPTV